MARFASRFQKTPQANKKDDKLFYIHKVNSWVYEKVSIGNSISNPYGEIEINYGTSMYSYSAGQKIKLPISSMWLDPGDTNTLKSCKIYATIPSPSSPQYTDDLQEFIEHCFINHHLKYSNIRPEHSITIDDRRQMLRFGTSSGSTYTSVDKESGAHISIYDTKPEALIAVLDVIREYTTAKITGLDVINMNAVPDKILVELGFQKVEDYFGKAPPMWYGDPLKLISSNSESVSNYFRRSYGRNQVSEEIVNSFLDILEKELA